MMDWSDRHCRFFWRLLSEHVLLYTEMVTTGALIHGDRERFLRFNPEEHPLALQLGGSEPEQLAQCSQWAAEQGFDEINLNCGCPSDRVQSGRFGACLMAEPERVRDCVSAMQDSCEVPITVKHRIGIDDMESFAEMLHFVDVVAGSGCKVFIVHARKAWLQGLSPKQNREVPPLHYDWVYRLKTERPELEIIINGGIDTLDACRHHLAHVDGVMLGREAYQNPYLLAAADQEFYGSAAQAPSREQVITRLLPYVTAEHDRGTALHHITRHILGLFQGVPGARKFRRHLSENAWREGAGIEVLEEALAIVSQHNPTPLKEAASL